MTTGRVEESSSTQAPAGAAMADDDDMYQEAFKMIVRPPEQLELTGPYRARAARFAWNAGAGQEEEEEAAPKLLFDKLLPNSGERFDFVTVRSKSFCWYDFKSEAAGTSQIFGIADRFKAPTVSSVPNRGSSNSESVAIMSTACLLCLGASSSSSESNTAD